MDVGGVASFVGLKGRNKEEEGGKKIEKKKKDVRTQRCVPALANAVRVAVGAKLQCRAQRFSFYFIFSLGVSFSICRRTKSVGRMCCPETSLELALTKSSRPKRNFSNRRIVTMYLNSNRSDK
jgi:hypothetical protein